MEITTNSSISVKALFLPMTASFFSEGFEPTLLLYYGMSPWMPICNNILFITTLLSFSVKKFREFIYPNIIMSYYYFLNKWLRGDFPAPAGPTTIVVNLTFYLLTICSYIILRYIISAKIGGNNKELDFFNSPY